MRKVLNMMLVLSLLIIILLGFLLYREYEKSLTVDTTMLEINAALYQEPIVEKDGRVEDVSVNYIFYLNKEKRSLSDVVIEVLHSNNKMLTFIKIPVTLRVELSSKLYQKLATQAYDVPQFFVLSHITNLFDKEKRFAYLQLILDETLSIDSSFYTVIEGNQASYKEYQEVLWTQYGNNNEDGIKQLIERHASECKSNLTIEERLSYVSSYYAITDTNLTYTELEGIQHTEYFEFDDVKFQILIQRLMRGEQI